MVLFVESAFKHGYEKEDFFEVLETGPMKLRSRRGLEGIYELLCRMHIGEYLHIAYRHEPDQTVVFHMRVMTPAERARYRKR